MPERESQNDRQKRPIAVFNQYSPFYMVDIDKVEDKEGKPVIASAMLLWRIQPCRELIF